MNVEDVKFLRQVKEEISELTKQLDGLKRRKNELETKIISDMQAEGLSLARTDYGTPSITKLKVASVKDWTAFEEYIYEKVKELTVKQVSVTENLSPEQVQNIFSRQANQKKRLVDARKTSFR